MPLPCNRRGGGGGRLCITPGILPWKSKGATRCSVAIGRKCIAPNKLVYVIVSKILYSWAILNIFVGNSVF